MKALKVGLIGYKFMGKAHSNAWRQVDKFFPVSARPEMHTICGRDQKGVTAAAAQLGWSRVSTRWQDVVADPEIDILDITTANDTHAEIAIAAANAGKHVICEKPLALTVAEAEAMLKAAEKAGVVHMVCHNYRRIPAIAQAKKMIAAGDLGRIFHYRARYLQDWIVDPEVPLVWRFQGKIAGSGAQGDINAHIIDLARYLVGEFTEVSGHLETFIKERPLLGSKTKKGRVTVDDAVITLGRFKNGALGVLEATRMAAGRKNHIQLEINGSKGSLVFDLEDLNRLKYYSREDAADRQGYRDILVTESVHPYAGAWWPPGHILGYEHTFVHTIFDFIEAVVKGKPVQPTFADGLQNQRVMEAIQESSQQRRWIQL
jgi:predicted dehydrogenase